MSTTALRPCVRFCAIVINTYAMLYAYTTLYNPESENIAYK